MIREYRNGVIAETSPIRIAETIALYPTTPNKTPNIKNRPVLISGHRNGSSKNNVRTMPDIATDRNPCMPRVKIFSDFETARLARSLPAKPNIPSTNGQQQNNSKNNRFTSAKPKKPRRKPAKILPRATNQQDDREIDNVIFVPYTPGGALRKEIQKEDDYMTKMLKINRTKFVERAGVSLLDTLVDKNPWVRLQGGCQRPNCYPCKSSLGKGISCRKESIVYEISCAICEQQGNKTIYIGESSRSFFERAGEHMQMFKMKREGNPENNEANSVFWGHSKEKHESSMTTKNWNFKILSSHQTPLDRQVTEAVKIARVGTGTLLNAKNEFGCNNLPELQLQYGNLRGTSGDFASKRKPGENKEF